MAKPLRVRYDPGQWTGERALSQLYEPLDANLGARVRDPWFRSPEGYAAYRFEMDDGSLALFCWTENDPGPGETKAGPGAYWVGNTETPSRLWRTDKYDFAEIPSEVAEWFERELLAGLYEAEPWLRSYPALAWFFLPVFCSKDGAETTRAFFRDYAAGFPDATREEAAAFYEAFLATGGLADFREEMAAKLGTSEFLDLTRMTATMGEFDVAKLLIEAGHQVTPEIEVTTGHSLDFRAEGPDAEPVIVEVTRPLPPSRRKAESPVQALRETAKTKAEGQLKAHGGGATLFVDCSSFPDDDWGAVRAERPRVHHRPAVVFRTRPSGHTEAYADGDPRLALDEVIDWLGD